MTPLCSRTLVLLGLVAALVLSGNVAVAPQAQASEAVPSVTALRTNSLEEPLGISGTAPSLSWQVAADRRGMTQGAYEVHVASTAGGLDSPDVWDSGKVDSAQSVDVAYDGPALSSATRYLWSVRVWDDQGTASAWSPAAWFETGLLDDEEWAGEWIGTDDAIGAEWTDYSVRFTATVDNALGLYFRGRDDSNAYMWQINEGLRALRPHVKSGGGYSVLTATPFPDGFDFSERHEYEVTVAGDEITTRVDGDVLDSRTDGTHAAPGIMGFRSSAGESGVVRDVTVTSADGTVLLDTDFPPGDANFPAARVTADGLVVDGANPEAWLATGEEVPALRKAFDVPAKTVRSARVYAAAQGVYELRLNGQRVGDHELAPGWTDYAKRIQYQTYDVTDLVQQGANAIGAELSDGWYAGRLAIFGDEKYGSQTALVAQLRIKYTDGSTDVIATDDTWRTAPGAIVSADLLDGERYDARRAQELGAWSESPYDDSGWEAVAVRPSATDLLEPQEDQPVRVTEQRSATAIESPTPGAYLYDLGQNMVGKVSVTLTGEPGQTVKIRHGEVLNPDGTLYVANLRSAKATDYYTFATSEPETYTPSFTFHGFRYVEISGVDTAPPASAVSGLVMGTDGDLVSDLETSSPMVNQLHSNIVWGQRGNFLSIPTDTPARDERMGWTGDINVFARTAVYNMDSQAFLTKWLQDLRDTQRSDGAFPGVAPVIPGSFDGGYGPAGWADAGVNVPWTLWQAYGDTGVIDENYTAMKRYVDYLARDSTGYIRSTGGYLDWLNLDDPTPADVLDTAFVAKSTRQFAQMAAAVGNDADAAAYTQRYEAIRSAYQDAFIAEDGSVKGDSQTAYILTITNDLVPDDRREALADQFVETIERRDWHLSTGFLGVDGLLPALTAVDRTDVAYRLLQNEDYPSWGYEISQGATTIWERWNSIMPDGSFGPVDMNSFNHYAYGAVGEWMYRTLAGVSALEPGYARTLIAPTPGDGVTSSDFSYETPYGTVGSAWRQTEAGLELDVSVPGNTTAVLRMPTSSRWAVTEGGVPAELAEGVQFLEMDGDTAVYEIGSGSYSFATDEVLGSLGEAVAAVDALETLVDEMAADGRLDDDSHEHLQEELSKLDQEVAKAWDGHLAGRGDMVVEDVHRALKTAATLDRWITTQAGAGRIAQPVAESLHAGLSQLGAYLSAASSALTGVAATLVVPQGELLPGDVVRVQVVVENSGDRAVKEVTSALEAPPGWRARPVGAAGTTVAPGGSVTHAYDVEIPADQVAGTAQLTGTLSYRYKAGAATLPLAAEVVVVPAVVIESVQVTPDQLYPGDTGAVRTVLRNRGSSPASVDLAVTVPDGWTAPAPTSRTLAPGEEVVLQTPLTAPLSVTEGPVTVGVSTGATDEEQRSTSVSVAFTNPPSTVLDHVDLGDAASEQAHALTASAASGTNVEAGLTRRYTNAGVPGGWYEFDLEVTPGEPFILRGIETFDGPQHKTYDVLVDGVRVHARDYPRPASGVGTVTYQFVVDQPEATQDGVVRVRFQDTGADHDPSIADVWAIPATAAAQQNQQKENNG